MGALTSDVMEFSGFQNMVPATEESHEAELSSFRGPKGMDIQT